MAAQYYQLKESQHSLSTFLNNDNVSNICPLPENEHALAYETDNGDTFKKIKLFLKKKLETGGVKDLNALLDAYVHENLYDGYFENEEIFLTEIKVELQNRCWGNNK